MLLLTNKAIKDVQAMALEKEDVGTSKQVSTVLPTVSAKAGVKGWGGEH